MAMRYCEKHGQVFQPESLAHLSRHGRLTPITPAHWRPIALGILQHAAAWATAGHCALPVEVVACDVCARERSA